MALQRIHDLEFDRALKYGNEGEDIVMRELSEHHGCSILPANGTDRGGFIKVPAQKIALRKQFEDGVRLCSSADFLSVGPRGKLFFGEVKRKSRVVFHRVSKTWRTGCDYRSFDDYRSVQRQTGIPVILFFLHDSTDLVPQEFRGIFWQFAGKLEYAGQASSKTGVVYWEIETHLIKMAGFP